MACVLVPAAEAIVVTAAAIAYKHKESKLEPETFTYESAHGTLETREKVSFSRKLSWLSSLLWGGVLLLVFEHVWHGEITPFFPFLTGATSPQHFIAMLNEMSTVGVAMSAVVTAVWVVMLVATAVMEKKALKTAHSEA